MSNVMNDELPPDVRPPLAEHLGPLPTHRAVERLRETLEGNGMGSSAAAVIANATVDPAGFRRGMQSPIAFRTPLGDLLTVFTRVWSPAVVPFATNPRVYHDLAYAVAGDDQSRALGSVRPSADDRPELEVDAPSRESVASLLAMVSRAVATENPLKEDIGLNGVQEPVTLVAMTFHHADGDDDTTVLAAADGSSRVAAAHLNLEVAPEVVAYQYAADPAQLRGRLGRLIALSQGELSDLDPSELIRLNSLTLPALVVIGFEPRRSGHQDFSRAVNARIGAIHVAPPKPWKPAARLDVQLDTVLDAMVTEDLLPTEWVDFYAGRLSFERADQAELPAFEDARAANLAVDLQTREFVRPINAALRNVAVAAPTPATRAAVAAEGALRAFRSKLPETEVTAARNLLQHLYAMAEFRTAESRAVSGDADGLLADALGGDQEAAFDLLLLAAYWLARYRLVRRTTRGRENDRRDIANVLREVATSEHGQRQLHQIIVDGRDGTVPRRVLADGQVVRPAGGDTDLPVDENWIRTQWGRPDSGNDETEAPPTPEAALQRLEGEIETAVGELRDLVAGIGEVRDPDGSSTADRLGLRPDLVREVVQILNFEILGPLLARGSRTSG